MFDAIDGNQTVGELIALRLIPVNDALTLFWGAYHTRLIVFSANRPGEYSSGLLASPSAMGDYAPAVPPGLVESQSIWQKLFEPTGTA